MVRFRLDSVAPSLAEQFLRASPSQRRQAALAACQHAAKCLGMATEEFGKALAVLGGATASDGSLLPQLEALAAKLDAEYFRLEEEGDPARKPEALRQFSKARATSAVAFALSPDDARLHEAIYEAIIAVDERADLERLVAEILG